jgi:hypothetical protein
MIGVSTAYFFPITNIMTLATTTIGNMPHMTTVVGDHRLVFTPAMVGMTMDVIIITKIARPMAPYMMFPNPLTSFTPR